ncbi:glycosyltransferase [Subtercola vilae]|uniref:glycosyltransferase n=1 Tax=Subtercola vilae TaxID=2056433 RepID=UPI0010AAD03A|nr:glycosyltransferase [Subtercola vilae]
METITIFEPSRSDGGSKQWLFSYIKSLATARRMKRASSNTELIVTWPLLGYLDSLIVGLLFGRNSCVVVHDTKPLVTAVGYGRVSQLLSSVSLRTVSLVIHSTQARVDIENARLRHAAILLPLPIHPLSQRRRENEPRTAVRVVGQFKPDRDVEGLVEVARQLNGRLTLEIVGRKWPAVEGWAVRDAFVPEEELDNLIETSTAIVIPYKRFYQSAIAIRALERETPIVGPAGTSLADLLGPDSGLLVRDSTDWARAVGYATSPEGHDEVVAAATAWREHSLTAWREAPPHSARFAAAIGSAPIEPRSQL